MCRKLVWSLLHNRGKFWVRILLSKYGWTQWLFFAKVRPYDSCLWKGILKAIAVLKDGYQVKLGNGQTSLWYDKWIANGPIYYQVPYVNIQDVDLCVRDIVGDSGWGIRRLATILSL